MGEILKHYLKQRQVKKAAELKIETARQVEAERAKTRRVADQERAATRASEQAQRDAQAAEKARLSAPVTRTRMADTKVALTVPHWRMPKLPGQDSAPPLLVLPHGGGVRVSASLLAEQHPELKGDEDFRQWVRSVKPLVDEVKSRYPILDKLRVSAWWARLMESSGLAISHTTEEQWQSEGMVGTRKVTTVVLPSISGVRIADDGLRIRIKHRSGDSLDQWTRALPKLRAAFSAVGLDAGNLRITEAGQGGGFVLVFDDAPVSFPRAVAPPTPVAVHSQSEAIRNYPQLFWEFGVGSRGEVIRSRCADSPHVALIAQTGWGKSVLSATIVEQMRCSGAMVMLFDGKGTDHPRHLGRSPGVIWLSKSPAEHVVGMAWLHAEMSDRYAQVDAANDGEGTTKNFAFPPIFVLVDELPSLRGAVRDADKKDKGSTFDWMLTDLLAKGRQCRIHVLLISQSLYVDSVPSAMQTNITRTVFLGPVDSRSLMSDDIPESAKQRVTALSSRIPESAKGRGVFMARGEGGTKVTQFQSYYGFSPGNTALADAPTPEIRESWVSAKAVSEALPQLYDRIGIKATDAEWRKLPMEELVQVPTIIVADENGAIEGRGIYDPLSKGFAGAMRLGANPDRARGRGAAGPAAVEPETVKPTTERPVPRPVAPLDIDGLTEAQRDDLIAKLLRARVGGDETESEPEEKAMIDEPVIEEPAAKAVEPETAAEQAEETEKPAEPEPPKRPHTLREPRVEVDEGW